MGGAHLEAGTLVRVLADWCEPVSGYYLYRPRRREPSPALAVRVEGHRFEAWQERLASGSPQVVAYWGSSDSSMRPRISCQAGADGVTKSKWPASGTLTSLALVADLFLRARA
jgi:hypothetical protein